MVEWLNLLLRWAHLIFGIAWIGSSFYFMWLDSNLEAPPPSKKDVEGELWMVHSGGFYLVERKLIEPGSMPATLHWFKYEALFTLVTGFLLLNLVYYFSGGAFLLDPSVSGISHGQGVALGLGVLIVSWIVYDLIWQSKLALEKNALALGLSILLAAGTAYLLCRYLSGRAAFIHLGAMFGTIMVTNVWMRILPSQQKMIDATKEGRKPDYTLSAKAKRRSVHNSYMTLPVLFMMISNHYATVTSGPNNWIHLLLLVVFGMAVRHVTLAKKRRAQVIAGLVALASLGVLMVMTTTPSRAEVNGVAVVSFTEVRPVIEKRCLPCHSPTPAITDLGMVPAGVFFDTPERTAAFAERIRIRAVETKTMPPVNKTGLTDEERELLSRWIASGASAGS